MKNKFYKYTYGTSFRHMKLGGTFKILAEIILEKMRSVAK